MHNGFRLEVEVMMIKSSRVAQMNRQLGCATLLVNRRYALGLSRAKLEECVICFPEGVQLERLLDIVVWNKNIAEGGFDLHTFSSEVYRNANTTEHWHGYQ